jgi:hypothetical protein
LDNSTITDNSTLPVGVDITNSSIDVNATITNGTDLPLNTTDGGSVIPPVVIPDNSTTPATGSGMINCCDYFQKGAGYEFSVCDGLGAIVRQEMVGGDRDTFYAAQPMDSMEFSWVW